MKYLGLIILIAIFSSFCASAEADLSKCDQRKSQTTWSDPDWGVISASNSVKGMYIPPPSETLIDDWGCFGRCKKCYATGIMEGKNLAQIKFAVERNGLLYTELELISAEDEVYKKYDPCYWSEPGLFDQIDPYLQKIKANTEDCSLCYRCFSAGLDRGVEWPDDGQSTDCQVTCKSCSDNGKEEAEATISLSQDVADRKASEAAKKGCWANTRCRDCYYEAYRDTRKKLLEKPPDSDLITTSTKLNIELTIYDGDKKSPTAMLPRVLVSGYDGKGNEFTKTTDTNGQIVLKGSPGTWHFEASKDGYETSNWDWEITASGSMRYFLFKSRTPEIEDIIGFYVIFHEDSLNGPELPGVRITGHDGAGKRFDKTANNLGQVGLPLEGSPGIWHFEASKDGYQRKIWDIEILAGGETRYAFLTKITDISPIGLYLTIHEGSIYGQILPGVRVDGHDGAGKNFGQITDTNGLIVLKGSPGTWHFEASMDDYQTNTWDQELISSASRDAFLVKNRIQDTPQVGCYEDPSTGQVICSDDASVFSELSTSGTGQITGTTFNKGDRVRTTSDKKLNVRTNPGTDSRSIGTMAKGSMGTIIDGPSFSGNLWWWKVEYDAGITGWSSGKWLESAPEAQIGCNKDPITGQVICHDDASVLSEPPIFQPQSDATTNKELSQPEFMAVSQQELASGTVLGPILAVTPP